MFLHNDVLDCDLGVSGIAAEVKDYTHLRHVYTRDVHPLVSNIIIFRHLHTVGHIEHVVVAVEHTLESHTRKGFCRIESDAEVIPLVGRSRDISVHLELRLPLV